jgi:general secretion pathway protein B
MSFILDALKKSETDRQRQNGPALFEVRVAPPRNGLPLWAIGLGVLLAVNLVIVAWVLLRKPATTEVAATAPPGQTAGSSGQQAMQPPPMTTYPQPQGYVGQGQQGYPQQPQYPQQQYPTQQQPPGAPQGGTSWAPQGQAAGQGPNTVPVSGMAPTTPMGQTAGMTQPAPGYPPNIGPAPGPPPGAPGAQQLSAGASNDGTVAPGAAGAEKLNPDDYAPATDAGPAAPFGNHVTKGTSSGVPLYQDATLAPGAHIPELRLDLHVFAAKPQDRFVMINMHKLHEGDSLPEGVHVDNITPEGAVLSKDGQRFLLPRD